MLSLMMGAVRRSRDPMAVASRGPTTRCAPGASDFVATCQIDFLPAEWVAYIAIAAGGVFGALALVGKLTRPGPKLASLFGSTAVVVPADNPKSVPGTVTPEQVAAP